MNGATFALVEPGTMRSASDFERRELVVVEELGLVGGRRGLLRGGGRLRLVGQVLVNRMLSVRDARQDEAGAEPARDRLEERPPAHAARGGQLDRRGLIVSRVLV